MLKNISSIFHYYFDGVEYLTIKLIIEIQNYIKTNGEKIIKYFSNIDYDTTTILQSLKLKFNLCVDK
jgi:hypothetical protein